MTKINAIMFNTISLQNVGAAWVELIYPAFVEGGVSVSFKNHVLKGVGFGDFFGANEAILEEGSFEVEEAIGLRALVGEEVVYIYF